MESQHEDTPGGIGMGSVLEFDDQTLLRAARVADVLHGCGRVLANSAGTADTYALSSRTTRIDVFISHNWAVGRRRKFVLLAMHFNLRMACQMAAITLALAASLTYLLVSRGYFIFTTYVPYVSTMTMLVFSMGLFYGHEAQALCGFRDKRSAFLDKVCIHQTDGSLKERGILSLGAFLHKSDSMVVCFTGLYLKKLWTVYEFACFLLVRGQTCPGAVHVTPASLPMFTLAGALSCFVGVVLTRLPFILGKQFYFVSQVLILVAQECVLLTIARRWAREQHEARALFKGFAFANASYSSEADQALVRRNIIQVMRHFAYVGTEASDAEALLAFDEFVRTAGLQAFLASVGRLGAPYRLFLPMQLTLLSDNIQWWSACAAEGCRDYTTAPQIAVQLLSFLTAIFLVLPLAIAMAFHLTKYCIGLRGAADVAFCGLVGLLETTVLFVLDPASGPLRPWLMGPALESVHSSVGFLLYCAALFIATALVYRQPQRQVGAPVVSPGAAGPSVQVTGEELCPDVCLSVAMADGCEVVPCTPIEGDLN